MSRALSSLTEKQLADVLGEVDADIKRFEEFKSRVKDQLRNKSMVIITPCLLAQ